MSTKGATQNTSSEYDAYEHILSLKKKIEEANHLLSVLYAEDSKIKLKWHQEMTNALLELEELRRIHPEYFI